MGIDRWLLPEGVEEILPPESWRLEAMRRRLLDLYRRRGYQLIVPPLIEYLDSLLTGAGHDLELQTFKLTDQLSGRLMGVRADMTPQAARIDASRLKTAGPARLCYIGTVLRALPDGLGGSRCPQQVGVELFGEPGIEGDLEIVLLMLETLALCGLRKPYLDLGHVGIYRALAAGAGFSGEQEETLFGVLQRKSRPDLEDFLRTHRPADRIAAWLEALIDLNGDVSVLARARSQLKGAGRPVAAALDTVERMAERLAKKAPKVPLHVDLAELRGYRYKTGIVFAAFAPGQGREIARGGRYDAAGRVFGRARPATGFSADLAMLLQLARGKSSKR
jgi:ATP phosphoribosyltransferase regulatory subunit